MAAHHKMYLNLNKTAKEGDYFFYQRGEVTTNKIWNRPSYKVLKKYLNYLEETGILDGFDCYLTGGVLSNFEDTWDVDILIKSEKSDKEIEACLNKMLDISLNDFNLLVDVGHAENITGKVSKYEMMNGNYHIAGFYKTIGYTKKIINDEVFIKDSRDVKDNKILTEYLIEKNYSVHKPDFGGKLIKKAMNCKGEFYINSFNVKTFLSTNEKFFLRNTNR